LPMEADVELCHTGPIVGCLALQRDDTTQASDVVWSRTARGQPRDRRLEHAARLEDRWNLSDARLGAYPEACRNRLGHDERATCRPGPNFHHPGPYQHLQRLAQRRTTDLHP